MLIFPGHKEGFDEPLYHTGIPTDSILSRKDRWAALLRRGYRMRYNPVRSGYPPYAAVDQAIEDASAEHGRENVRMPQQVYVTLGETGDFRRCLPTFRHSGLRG